MITIRSEISSAAEQVLVLKRDFAAPPKLTALHHKVIIPNNVSRFFATQAIVYCVILSTRAMISALRYGTY